MRRKSFRLEQHGRKRSAVVDVDDVLDGPVREADDDLAAGLRTRRVLEWAQVHLDLAGAPDEAPALERITAARVPDLLSISEPPEHPAQVDALRSTIRYYM